MKILFVAMSDSIHTARWINQIADQGWDIHLFPSMEANVHPALSHITLHEIKYLRQGPFTRNTETDNNIRIGGARKWSLPRGADLANRAWRFWKKLSSKSSVPDRTDQLFNLIHILQPDIIHSLEIQHAGYLVLEAKKSLGGKFPPWIVTNWGSDIYLFGRLEEHAPKIREVLSNCDYYSCECKRDVSLAKAYGFTGTVLPVFPNAGGFDLKEVELLRQTGLVSERRLIMLKGYQTWAGRALVGLRAIERCSDLLKEYELAVYCPSEDVKIAVQLFFQNTGIKIALIPFGTPHNEIMRLHGKARISIGLSISDAISTSLLEALVMNSFPIQSWTACADEWIEDGKNGILVPPEDPEIIENALRKALLDDDLVNSAAKYNEQLAQVCLSTEHLKSKAVEIYKKVAQESGINL